MAARKIDRLDTSTFVAIDRSRNRKELFCSAIGLSRKQIDRMRPLYTGVRGAEHKCVKRLRAPAQASWNSATQHKARGWPAAAADCSIE